MTHREFADKLEAHKNTVYRISFSYLKNIQDAEDITQEVFLKFYSCGVDFPAAVNEKAWLIKVTANLCKNQLRRNKFRKTVPFDEALLTGESSDFMESDIEAIDLLFALPPKYRTVLYLFYYERYTTREIALLLGKNENTVRTLLARGREKLRDILTDDLGHEMGSSGQSGQQGGFIYG